MNNNNIWSMCADTREVKSLLFNMFVACRRAARESIEVYLQAKDDVRQCEREIAELTESKNTFNRKRVKDLSEIIHRNSKTMKEEREMLCDMAPTLVQMCDTGDKVFSFREKAHLLGVSETHLKNAIGDREEYCRLFSMIFVCKAEYRGKDDLVPFFSIDMPLFAIVIESFTKQLKKDAELQKNARKMVTKCFPGLPMYQKAIDTSGNAVMKRLPPQFTVVKGGNA